MYIQQIYTNCLAHAAYYIESGREAAVIDPLRDTEQYIHLAAQRGASIKYVLETHFHADFVSGHLDLAEKTGAQIVFGPQATPGYKAVIAHDRQLLSLGNVQIKVLHTPGHTIESACYLLMDEHGVEKALFSGDTLFVGDVGRPDLLSGNLSKEELAAMLYDSINTKIKTLPDNITVYPGHGPGSACGKSIGRETFSTIGEQKNKNYALQATDKDDFISRVTSDLPVPPAYFFADAAINKKGYEPFERMMGKNLHALSLDEFTEKMDADAIVLDTRDAVSFSKAFIKGAINIGLNGDFAVWVGNIIDITSPLLLIATPGSEKEAITRLARIGFENVAGYLDGGIDTWKDAGKPVETIAIYDHTAYEVLLKSNIYTLLDVRRDAEYAHEKIKNAIHIPLTKLKNEMHTLATGKRYLVYCAGGYRSMIAASVLKANGFTRLACIEGGINEVKKVAPHMLDRNYEHVK